MKKALLGLGLLVLSATSALATGLFPGLPIEGGASYCASIVNGVCNGPTVPAGPTAPSGTEYAPFDVFGLSQATSNQGVFPQTVGIAASALGGFGPLLVNSTGGSAQIPNNTPNYIYTGAGTTPTFTLPAAPQPWQVQRIVIGATITTSFIVAVGAGQSCVPACPFTDTTQITAGNAVAYVWNPANSTWYKIQ